MGKDKFVYRPTYIALIDPSGDPLLELLLPTYSPERRDIIEINHHIKYAGARSTFQNDLRQKNVKVTEIIHPIQSEDAYFRLIMKTYDSETGTIGPHGKLSYLGLLYVYRTARQTRIHSAVRYWETQRRDDPRIAAMDEYEVTGFPENHNAVNYAQKFTDWFIGLVKAAPTDVQLRIRELLFKDMDHIFDDINELVRDSACMEQLVGGFDSIKLDDAIAQEETKTKAEGEGEGDGMELD